MEMNLSQAQELVTQVQTAHRLAVGFYQRLLPQLTRIAGELDMQFWYWKPAHTSRPCNSTTSPNNSWKWDLVPLFASRHAFWRVAGDQAQQGDIAVVFNIYLDEDFEPSRLKLLGIKGQPDPLSLKGTASAIVHLYRCTAENGQSFQELWNKAGLPSKSVHGWQDVGPMMAAYRIPYTLAQFIVAPDKVITDIQEAFAETTAGTN